MRMPANSKAAAFFRYSILATLVAALFGCDGSFNGNEPALANVALSGIIDIETGTRVDSDDAGTLALSASPPAPLAASATGIHSGGLHKREQRDIPRF